MVFIQLLCRALGGYLTCLFQVWEMGAELLTPTTALQVYSFCQEAWGITV